MRVIYQNRPVWTDTFLDLYPELLEMHKHNFMTYEDPSDMSTVITCAVCGETTRVSYVEVRDNLVILGEWTP